MQSGAKQWPKNTGAATSPILIEDSFTDSDGTALSAHTIAPTNIPATIWTIISGTWVINSNKAQKTATDATHEMATVDAGVSDCLCEQNLTLPASGYGATGYRISNATNGWLYQLDITGDIVALFEQNAGTYTQRASQGGVVLTGGATYAIAATLNGASITITIDGGNSINYASATHNQTTTKHGLWAYSTTPSMDTFKVSTL